MCAEERASKQNKKNEIRTKTQVLESIFLPLLLQADALGQPWDAALDRQGHHTAEDTRLSGEVAVGAS